MERLLALRYDASQISSLLLNYQAWKFIPKKEIKAAPG
jgi:hypothetical protein